MPRLVIEEGAETGRLMPLSGKIVLGREGENAIKDAKISRQHVRIFAEGEGFALADLNSRNGTLVNGSRVSVHTLRHGDLIRIGNTSLRYLDERQAPPAAQEAATPPVRSQRTASQQQIPAREPRSAPAPDKQPAAEAEAKRPAAAGADILFYRDRGPDGVLFEDLGQRNFAYKAGLVAAAIAAAVVLFFVVTALSAKLFE